MRRLTAVLALTAVAATAACQPVKKGSGAPNLNVNVVLGNLNNPWDIAFAPDAWYFTERSGTINAVVNGQRTNFGGPVPGVRTGGEGGMLGIAVDPSYTTNRFIYTCYSSTAPDNRVVKWFVQPDFSQIISQGVIAAMPYNTGSNGRHSGCRLKFGPDGFLWVGTGDAADGCNPQNPGSNGGKVLRIDGNGFGAPGNPFGNQVWTLGHRNVQGLAFRNDGQAYSVEHGPNRDDEINILRGGANYGWAPACPGYNENVPMTCCGLQGAIWSSGFPTIAPSGATFLYGPQWKGWNGALVVAVLKDRHLRVFFLNELGGIGGEQIALPNSPRLRSAVQGPDGNLYITTDVGGGGGQIWQVVPS